MIELRDYQSECVKAIDGMKSGSGLVCMATGLGKTVVFSRIRRSGKVLIISHREELVHQPLKYYDCPCGVEQGEETSHGEEIVSASVQSLIRRLDKFSPDEFDIIITDEAHHAAAESYKKIYSYFRPRIHVGFTATPNRGDKVRLDDVFSSIIFSRDLKWGIINGWLSDVKCMRVEVSYNLTKVKRRMGDFVASDLDKTINTTLANKEIRDIYEKYARGQTLIFAASVSHARNIAAEIEGAECVSADTKNRKEIIDRFTSREIPCLVNCMVFTEGTDMPLVETVIIARPTQNASLYTQMVGRGLRKAPGKKYLTLIDCVGVTGKLDICTAPTLMGLDIGDVPDYRKGKLEGLLTDMQEIVEEARECPETWILNVRGVSLFFAEQNVSSHRVNWTKKSNGDLVYQFADGERIGIKAMDELGNTKVMYYEFDDEKNKFRYRESEQTNLQTALDKAYVFFTERHEDERKLWDLKEYYNWQYAPASEKQKDYIKSRVEKDEWERLEKRGMLTKGEAAQILNMLSIRNLTPEKLLRMHEKKQKERADKKEELDRKKLLKVRKLINRSVRSRRYYALIFKDDLVVLNEWSKAADMIAEAEKNGDKVRYKGFSTIDEAVDFLKN